MAAFSARCATPDRRIHRIDIVMIHPNPDQPRREFPEAPLQELADSIRRCGLLSPLIVRRRTNAPGYELIAGERRLRALKMIGCSQADCILANVREGDRAILALIENLQREDLHFLDEAETCRRILAERSLTQEELAGALCKSPSALANRLRILRLSERTLRLVRSAHLSERHARALLRLESENEQFQFARTAAEKQWSVRQLEQQIEACLKARKSPYRLPDTLIRENRLVVNALRDTVRRLSRIGVRASSRTVTYEDHFDVIVTVQLPAASDE